MTTSTYLELKVLRFDEALREGNTAGHVDTRIREEPERRRNAAEKLLTPIESAVLDHPTDVSLAGHVLAGYQMDHFTEWTSSPRPSKWPYAPTGNTPIADSESAAAPRTYAMCL